MNTPLSRRRLSRSGLSLVELMINMAIVTTIFMAIATALTAMIGSFRGNESLVRSRHSATVALDYMLSYIRQAKILDLNVPMQANVSSGQLTVYEYRHPSDASKDRWRTFSYDASSRELRMSLNGGSLQTVLRNVNSLTFRSRPELDQLTNEATVRSVTVELIVAPADVAGKASPATFTGTAYSRGVPLT